MIIWTRRILVALILLVILLVIGVYFTLRASLPNLDGDRAVPLLENTVTLSRDNLGQAIIHAQSRADAAYAIGFAHAQDRFMQMDLQRRLPAGELSDWLGKGLLDHDKKLRFHQFRKHAERIYPQLPQWQRTLLEHYAQGVNDALGEMGQPPFEYLLTGFSIKPWEPIDSLLVIYSMYWDLQSSQVSRDITLEVVKQHYGQDMVDFILQPSPYQAALDGSIQEQAVSIPALPSKATTLTHEQYDALFEEPQDIGSNNWVVSGDLTASGSALLANDMHLGLRIPTTWYRAQLNYQRQGKNVQLTGVSLPGVPGIVVGTNGHIAWGFTNSNLDNTDWVLLNDDEPMKDEQETLYYPGGQESYTVTTSKYGPVRTIDGKSYALSWVAHFDYSIDIGITNFDIVTSMEEALPIAHNAGVPVQNFVVADAKGNIAWTPIGAVTARPSPSNTAIAQEDYSALWGTQESNLPVFANPEQGRIWTANARVISTEQLKRYGDGGYALGARGAQIRDRLFEQAQFDEQAFYDIQLDNEARFLTTWHALLLTTLKQQAEGFDADIKALENWDACACADSVGYTLVRRFRSAVMQSLLEPLAAPLEQNQLTARTLLRYFEPGTWQILDEQPQDWLPEGYDDYQSFLVGEYIDTKLKLETRYGHKEDLSPLRWGNVNALEVSHPFAAQIPLVGEYLNMTRYDGFGDSFMPAVQGRDFGASERFFVQPGKLKSAILTIPGGQSVHPLSDYYRAGFEDYAEHKNTPLLPGKVEHTLTFSPVN